MLALRPDRCSSRSPRSGRQGPLGGTRSAPLRNGRGGSRSAPRVSFPGAWASSPRGLQRPSSILTSHSQVDLAGVGILPEVGGQLKDKNRLSLRDLGKDRRRRHGGRTHDPSRCFPPQKAPRCLSMRSVQGGWRRLTHLHLAGGGAGPRPSSNRRDASEAWQRG